MNTFKKVDVLNNWAHCGASWHRGGKCPMAILHAVVLSLAIANANATIIDFESTSGGATPTDNAAVTGLFDGGGGTFVTFGFDTDTVDPDLKIDTDGRFEDRTNQDGSAIVAGGSAYVFPASSFTATRVEVDGDATASDGPTGGHNGDGVGGSWLLRAPRSDISDETNVDMAKADGFLIQYSGVLPSSASGQIWDIDSAEAWKISALDLVDAIIGSPILLSAAAANDGQPSIFSFSNLTRPISKIRIEYTGTVNVGFAFDNFNATSAVPEPTTLALFTLGIAGIWIRLPKS